MHITDNSELFQCFEDSFVSVSCHSEFAAHNDDEDDELLMIPACMSVCM